MSSEDNESRIIIEADILCFLVAKAGEVQDNKVFGINHVSRLIKNIHA